MLMILFKLIFYQVLVTNLKTILFYVIAFIFFQLSYNYLNSEDKRNFFIKTFISALVIAALIGIAHFHLFPHINLQDRSGYTNELMGIVDYNTMKSRETGTMLSPVSFGHMLSFGIVLLLFQKYKFKWIFISILFYGIIISNTRSALLLIIGYMVLHHIDVKSLVMARLNFKRLGATIVVAMLALAVFVYFDAKYNNLQIGRLYATGIEPRLQKFIVGFQLLTENFGTIIFGLSPFTSQEINGVEVSDNSYLQFLLFTGCIGIIPFSLMILSVYKRIRYLKYTNHQDNSAINYINMVKSCSLIFMVYSLFSNSFNQLPQLVTISVLLGSLYAMKKNLSTIENQV